jgi:Short C-terminal domain
MRTPFPDLLPVVSLAMQSVTTAASPPPPGTGPRPARRGVVTALLIAAAVLTFLYAMASWVDRQVLDTDEWTNTSSQLLENENIRDALATYLVDQLYSNVDVQGELRAALPPETRGLAGPAAGGLREFAQRAARRALAGPRVQASWEQLNRAAHAEFVAIVKDEGTANISTTGGNVTLELQPLVQDVAQRVGLSKLAQKLPPDAGALTVLKSDQLGFAQDLVDFIQKLVIVLLVLGLALYGLALYFSRGRRRETLRAIGLIFMTVGVLLLILRGFAGNIVVDELAKTAAGESVANDVWTIGTSLLSAIAGNLIINGLIILVAAWVAGSTAPALALRRASAGYMRDRPGIPFAVVGLIFLILVAWGPTPAFQRPVFVLLTACLLALGTEALRRQTLHEFPDARLVEGEGLRESWSRMRDSASQRVSEARSRRSGPTGETAAAVVAPEDAQIERLERLAALRERGVINDEEFEAQKSRILG